MINYYAKFLPNLSSRLYRLLQKHAHWQWGDKQQKIFQEAKEALVSVEVLAHYDPDKQLILQCDASQCGVGAVLSHQYKDGSDRLVAFASCSCLLLRGTTPS